MKVQIELFTTNVCSRCVQAKSVITGLVEELGDDQFELTFVDVVENLDHAVKNNPPLIHSTCCLSFYYHDAASANQQYY